MTTPSPVGRLGVQPEVPGTVPGQGVQLDEAALVEQLLDALAGGLLALAAALVQHRLGAGVQRLLVAAAQLGELACRGVDVRTGVLRAGVERLSGHGREATQDTDRGVPPGGPTCIMGLMAGNPGSPYGDLERPPLRAEALARALAPDGWRVEVLGSAGSTNQVVAERARAGEPAGLVVVAEEQTAGRGRLDRSWVSPPRAGLTLSVLLRPDLPADRLAWVPLWGGLAVAAALREQAGLDAVLKWPNDVLVAERKVAGLLAEVPVDGVVVLGVGLNVTTTREELPVPGATSMALEGASTVDRDTVLRAVLRSLTGVLGQASPQAYRDRCSTLGRQVRIELPGGRSVSGTAEGIDDAGRLLVDGAAHGVGDVVHLRQQG